MRIGVDGRNLTASFSGIGRYLVEMLRQLSANGHSIVLYLPSPPARPLDPEVVTQNRIATFGPGNALQRQFWGQIRLPLQIRADDLDVFWGPAHRLPTFLPSGLPRVVTVHDLVWYYFGETMRGSGWLADRLLMPGAVKSADMVVADSRSTQQALQTVLSVPLKKTRVVYPGTTAPANIAGEAADDVPSQPFILFVGTLEPRKNLERLLQAYAGLDRQLRNSFPLVIAGAPGWRQRNVDEIVTALGLTDNVQMLGFVTEQTLDALYRRCSFVAFPSLYEGFGFPIVEANRVGKPTLTSSSSSMIEVAGDANLMIDPLDVGDISRGLARLMTDRDLLAQLSSRSRANAARFDWHQSGQELIAVFEQAIANRRASR